MPESYFDRAQEDFPSKAVYAPEAEQAVLGAVMKDPSVLPQVIEILKPESFYNETHKKIFGLLVRMFSDARTEDMVTVINEAVNTGVFESSAMAKSYLLGMVQNVPAVSNVSVYANIVSEKYHVRRLVDVANDILEKAGSGTEEASELLDRAEQNIYDIRNGEIRGLTRIDSVIIDAYDHLQELSGEDRDKHTAASTGFSQLDQVTSGLNNSDLIIVAARPAMGKSAFALNIAVNMCRRSGKDVAIFSLEMGKEQMVTRMLSSEAMVNNTVMRTGELKREDWDKLVGAVEKLSQMPIYLDDGAGVTVPQMKAKLRRLKNLGLVVIDYLQLMESPNKHSSRVNEVSEITRQLKLMAKELNVPVIALSQLSRSSEKRDDKRPMLSDLRESGSIEQDADIIIFLYRDAYYNPTAENKTLSECIVAKNRHGETRTVNLSFMGEYTLFRGVDMRRDEH
ncbi:MAG: replicative DNA helicase [Ruminococcus sp.]|nr:replicative DNA helicase [Ruminococcus sp.]